MRARPNTAVLPRSAHTCVSCAHTHAWCPLAVLVLLLLLALSSACSLQPLLDRCAFRDPIARGLATAGSAHGLGTAALARKCGCIMTSQQESSCINVHILLSRKPLIVKGVTVRRVL